VVAGDTLTEVDAQITHWFHTHATPDVTRYMLLLTDLHGTTGVSLLALALAFFLFWNKKWYRLLTLVIALPGGMLINVLLKGEATVSRVARRIRGAPGLVAAPGAIRRPTARVW
jgi:hypothetical protein